MSCYIIETTQLGLREVTMDDFDAWKAILADPMTMRFYPKPYDDERIKNLIGRSIKSYRELGFGLWAVILRDTGEFIGDCGITMQNIHADGNLLPEIGYHIHKNFWRQGYATQAAKACLQYAFTNTTFDELYSYQKSTNIPSQKTAEKIGMTFREEYPDPVNTKVTVYSITRTEFTHINR